MFLFDLLFRRKKPAAAPAPAAAAAAATATAAPSAAPIAPGTQIHHDVGLIAGFKEDHRNLLAKYQQIDAAAKAGDFAAVQALLGEFQSLLTDHLLKENVRLYVYLEHLLLADPVSHQMMHGFRHEMDVIGRTVVGFLGKYKTIAADPALAATFPADLAAIGQALGARIKREEDVLYPMYVPPTA